METMSRKLALPKKINTNAHGYIRIVGLIAPSKPIQMKSNMGQNPNTSN
jgi:hypothetical protein